jgi:hypothetical protein
MVHFASMSPLPLTGKRVLPMPVTNHDSGSTPSRTRYLLDIYKTKSYLPETYLIDNYLVTYCHLLKISFLNILYISFLDILNISMIHL